MTQPYSPVPTLLDLVIEQLLQHLDRAGTQIKDLPISSDLKERLRETVLNQLGVDLWIDISIHAIERSDAQGMRSALDEVGKLVASIHRTQILSQTQKEKTAKIVHDLARRLDNELKKQ